MGEYSVLLEMSLPGTQENREIEELLLDSVFSKNKMFCSRHRGMPKTPFELIHGKKIIPAWEKRQSFSNIAKNISIVLKLHLLRAHRHIHQHVPSPGDYAPLWKVISSDQEKSQPYYQRRFHNKVSIVSKNIFLKKIKCLCGKRIKGKEQDLGKPFFFFQKERHPVDFRESLV